VWDGNEDDDKALELRNLQGAPVLDHSGNAAAIFLSFSSPKTV
jgi:hypothetical protein